MPRTSLPPLNAVRVFEAAARLGGFKAAANELRVTPSAVSHQIARLESFLGVALFDRQGRRVSLNGAGEIFLRHVDESLRRLALATETVRSNVPETALTVLAAPSFASKWLIPRIDRFLHDHPEWRVRVEATTSRQMPADADIGIFYGQPDDAGLTATPIVAERLLVLCSPALLEGGPPIAHPSDLAAHVLIEANNRRIWSDWLKAHGLNTRDFRAMMSVERSSIAIDTAARGLGVILESDFLAADELADGKLVAPFHEEEFTQAEEAYFLATRASSRHKPPVDAFISWIGRELGARASPG